MKYAKKEISNWYDEVLERADILDNRYPLKGCYVWRPYGWQIMKNIMKIWDNALVNSGHQEARFPLLIPESLFGKESKHLRGFEEQVYWVTRAGRRELDEKLIIRPTSETAIYPMYSLWIRSHKDLPLRIYQNSNVMRYESKSTRPLIRDREIFPWFEAHTAHATLEDAEEQIKTEIKVLKEIFNKLSLPYLILNKPKWELFPGAISAIEFYSILPNGVLLENGSVNNLGQAFSKVYDIKFRKQNDSYEYVWQTCTGNGERLLAAVILIHGDDYGLVLPPSIAPIHSVIVPIPKKGKLLKIKEFSEEINEKLNRMQITSYLDVRKEITPGEKFYDWDLKGVPTRVEIGEKEIENDGLTVYRRDIRKRVFIHSNEINKFFSSVFDDISNSMMAKAINNTESLIKILYNYDELRRMLSEGYVAKISFCGSKECSDKIKDDFAADVVGLLYENISMEKENCIVCGKSSIGQAIVGKTF
ncbi:MAG: proline--tRNA ligase [Candidatus Aenigmatarchaeota archaeon]